MRVQHVDSYKASSRRSQQFFDSAEKSKGRISGHKRFSKIFQTLFKTAEAQKISEELS